MKPLDFTCSHFDASANAMKRIGSAIGYAVLFALGFLLGKTIFRSRRS